MIEEAMIRAGEQPAVSGMKQNPALKKLKQDADETQDGSRSQRGKDPKKQELLEKRKKYDPRAAIKKQKQSIQIEKESIGAIEAPVHQPSKSIFSGRGLDMSELPDEDDTQPKKHGAPKPYLKRKTKAVLVQDLKKQQKEESKAPATGRIDCWHRDKDTNVVIYGNKTKKNLMQKSPA